MFYETAQTVGPGWHRSYKPPHYKEMSWSPPSRSFRSPGSSPETYRRIIRTEEDFPTRNKEPDDEEFFNSGGRRSPTFPRRIFKEVWNDTSPSTNRFSERPRMFKRVFKPNHWEDEVPNLRRAEFDRKFEEDFERPRSRRFDDDFDRRFNRQKDMGDNFEKSEGKVHHIPIMVERTMEEMKSRFGKNMNQPAEDESNEDEYSENWTGPQVQRLRKTFETGEDQLPSTKQNRSPRVDANSKSRTYANSSIPDTWDPHAVHTLPTRKIHKASQSFDDSRHPVPPKYVFRSSSETHEDMAKPQQPHSAAFRSHSDGHCPNQTYVTKIEVNLPTSKKEGFEQGSTRSQSDSSKDRTPVERAESSMSDQTCGGYAQQETCDDFKPKHRGKYDNPALQQIASVLQNVEDLVVRVEGYSGTGRDKQYRFLDEMLTRCMLRLDDVDTEGREDIRNARKAAVRKVQSCVDRLEARADESERRQKSDTCSQEVSAQEAVPEVIPLGGVPEAIPQERVPDAIPEVIPLGDVPGSVPQVIPLGGVSNAIPLGYVPNVEETGAGKSTSETNVQNGEQTKL